jgi:hypothetical protein
MNIVEQAITDAITAHSRLGLFGFREDDYGQWVCEGPCRVTLYQVGDDWELDIHLPNGSVVGGDIPLSTFGGKTAAERDAERDTRETEDDTPF